VTEENQDAQEQAAAPADQESQPAAGIGGASQHSAPSPAEAPASLAKGEDPLYYWGTGRRKTSVARVRLKPNGSGKVFVNKRDMDQYFYRHQDRKNILDPMKLTKTNGKFDIFVNVDGGGMSGQSGATRLGVARALIQFNPEYTDMLRASGFLTRDGRKSERKKYGQRGARASFQFSKR
jgi:small subunit ribosomal protein S9